MKLRNVRQKASEKNSNKKTQKLLPRKTYLDHFIFTRCYLVLLLIILSVAQQEAENATVYRLTVMRLSYSITC